MSLKEIRLIRILMWILLYLVTLFLLIFLLVIPAVKSYKSVNRNYTETRASYMSVRNGFKTIYDRLEALRSKHRRIIEVFGNRWDEEKFIARAKEYFLHIELKPVDINTSDTLFRIYEIDAMTKIDSPQNFYRFLDSLSRIPFAVQADFPIAFKTHGDDRIEGIFRIRVYEEKKESNASNPSVSKR